MMEIFSRIRAFFHALLNRGKLESDLRDELQFHLETYADDLMAKRGLFREEALRQARIDFGSVDKCSEAAREARGLRFPDDIRRNVQYALRQFRHHPGFAIVSILTLGLGIGVNAAIFSIYDQALFRPLPVPNPERLVNLTSPGPKSGGAATDGSGGLDDVFSYPLFRDLEKSQTVFTGIAAHCRFSANLASKGVTQSGSGMLVSGSYFPVLGVRAELGRLLGPEDDRIIGERHVVVLSYDYWQTRFGKDRHVLNQVLVINGQPMTIVGVVQRGFRGTATLIRAKVFVPMTIGGFMIPGFNGFKSRLEHRFYLFARLKPGPSLEEAQVSLNVPYRAIINGIEAPLQIGMSDQKMAWFKAKTIILKEGARGQPFLASSTDKKQMNLILCLTMLVWIIACVNVANLFLARGAARQGEIAVRLSMGANRMTVVAQLLTEFCLLSLFGGAAAILLAQWTIKLLFASVPPEYTGIAQFAFNMPVFLFTATLMLASGLFFGLFPALHSTRSDLASSLKVQAGRQTGAKSAARFRTLLSTVQISLSLALLVVAGCCTRSLFLMSRINPGMKVDNTIVFRVSPSLNGYDFKHSAQFFERLGNELSALPGVTGVTNSLSEIPGEMHLITEVSILGYAMERDADASTLYDRIGPAYFRTLGIPLLAGREFTPADTEGSAKVAIVNEAFAEKFKLGRNAIGRHIGYRLGPMDIEIVGLVKNARAYLAATPSASFYRPYRQDGPDGDLSFYVRTSTKPDLLMPAIKKVEAQLDPNLPIDGLLTMRQQLRQNPWDYRALVVLTVWFACLAVLLTAVGLHGVLAFAVVQRTREIGLRIALGASPARMRANVFGQAGVMTLIGCTAGVALAIGLIRAMQSMDFFYQNNGLDPAVFCGSAALIALVTAAAVFVPAYRASKIDPMTALRYE
jgi:predicted permease